MTNKERQVQLNRIKWYESERANKDLSGYMRWCGWCDYYDCVVWYDGDTVKHCKADRQETNKKCYCATAYNRMMRDLNNIKQ